MLMISTHNQTKKRCRKGSLYRKKTVFHGLKNCACFVSHKTLILGCSALQKRYREILRSADPIYVPGTYLCSVKFVLLDVRAEVLAARLGKRAAEGNHFMPAKTIAISTRFASD